MTGAVKLFRGGLTTSYESRFTVFLTGMKGIQGIKPDSTFNVQREEMVREKCRVQSVEGDLWLVEC